MRIRHPLLWTGTLCILVGVVAVFAAVMLLSGGGDDRPAYAYPVQTFEDLGRTHMPPGQVFDGYSSEPPTSGPHSSVPAPWGVSDVEQPKEVPVHNMEHGGVVVWYNCAGGPSPLDKNACEQLRSQLAGIVTRLAAGGRLVMMTPYSNMPDRIALTAWQTLDAFDEFDLARVQAFISAYERRFNPEGF